MELSACDWELHNEPSLRQRGYISDGCLFSSLGFSDVCRVDYSDYEAPDVLFDLNQSTVPERLEKRFDLVLDSGTLEHIFDVPAALRNCAAMAAPQGRIIHLSPASNCVDHGLYSLSPTLFVDFYNSCGFAIEEILLCRIPNRFERGAWRIYEYPLADRRALPLGRLDGAVWMVWAVVTAKASTRQTEPVQQASYVATWQASQAARRVPQASPSNLIAGEPEDSRAGRLLALVRRFPWVARCLHWAIQRWRNTLLYCQERLRGRIPFRYLGRV